METLIQDWNGLQEASKILKEGGVVCFPTETVYGMGAIASQKGAFEKLVQTKRRPPEKPFTLMCSSITQAMEYVELDVHVIALMQAFMPGQITLLVKPRENLPTWITLGSHFIGIRIPDSSKVLELIEKVGEPLLVPSANISGEPTSKDFAAVKKVFDGVVDMVIEGECSGTQASTIVSVTPEGVNLVREGPISFSDIENVFQKASLTVSLAADHGAFVLKNVIREHLRKAGVQVLDEGTYSADSCDYPDFAAKAARDVATGKAKLGVLCCTSGEGVMMAANKIKGVRCGLGYDDMVTGKCREHNDANMISFGAAYMKQEDVLRRVDIFLSEKASPLEKHHRRVAKIGELEL